MFNFFKKKPEVKLKPKKITVVLPDGSRNVHHAMYRRIFEGGRLSLHDEENGDMIVADYAGGAWSYIYIE